MTRFSIVSARSLYLALTLSLTLVATGCATSSNPQQTTHASQQNATQNATQHTTSNQPDHDASVKVKGMSCPQCAHTLKLIMDKDDAIRSATVDLGAGIVYMRFNAGKSLTKDEIASLVKDSGFTPGEIAFAKAGGR